MNTKLIIKEGKDLTKEELNIINFWREKEFGSKNAIQPKEGDDNWNKKYLLLFNDINILVAFGRLHEVNLEFLDKKYNVLGIATIVSVERGKGYGKDLVLGIKKFIEASGKTGIGFCNKKLTEFYRNCGLGTIADGTLRFLYKNDNDELVSDSWGGGDVIYIAGKDKLVEELLANPDEEAITYRQHW